MIRPLRRRHRRLIPALFLLLALAMALALLNPPASTRVDALPPAVVAAAGAGAPR